MMIKIVSILAVIALIMYKVAPLFIMRKGIDNLAKGNLDEGKKLLLLALKGLGKRFKLNAAYGLLKYGFIEEAEEAFYTLSQIKETKTFNPQEAKAFLALAYWQKGDIQGAANLLESLIEVNYQTTILYTNLGFFLNSLGDLDKALEVNLQAFDYDAESKGIRDNLGRCYILRGEWEKASEVYEELFKESEIKFPEAYLNAALVKEHFDQKESALGLIESGLALDFDSLSTVEKSELEDVKSRLEI